MWRLLFLSPFRLGYTRCPCRACIADLLSSFLFQLVLVYALSFSQAFLGYSYNIFLLFIPYLYVYLFFDGIDKINRVDVEGKLQLLFFSQVVLIGPYFLLIGAVFFFLAGIIFKQSIFKQKPINNLVIVSFLILKSLWLPVENCFRNEFLAANVSFE